MVLAQIIEVEKIVTVEKIIGQGPASKPRIHVSPTFKKVWPGSTVVVTPSRTSPWGMTRADPPKVTTYGTTWPPSPR